MRLVRWPRPRHLRLVPLVRAPLALSIVALLLGCGAANTPVSTDPRGEVKRVISLVPALTEMTYALGEQGRLVGVSFYCRFPPEAREKPRVGALINADYEHILSLKPDCMILRPEQEEVAARLAEYGIPSIRLQLHNIDDIRAAIVRLGELYAAPEAADRVIAAMNDDLRQSSEAARIAFGDPAKPGLPPWRPRVLFVVGRNPGTLQQIYAGGTGSFVEELINAAGGRNVLENTALPWPVVGKEALLSLDPDVIIDGSFIDRPDAVPSGETGTERLLPWQQLGILRAVREGRVLALEDDHMLIPGPSVGRAARRLGQIIRRAFPERTWTPSAGRPAPAGPDPDAAPAMVDLP